MASQETLKNIARTHGTPVVVIDHDVLRSNYEEFQKRLPRVQIYYAVKANPDPSIVKTFYDIGSSFDVASWFEFQLVYDIFKQLPIKERKAYIWEHIIYANPIKAVDTLVKLNEYKPLVTFDNFEEIKKIKKYAPDAGLMLRLKVPNTGSVVQLSSKFGADPGIAVDLIEAAEKVGLDVEGVAFHVGSQATNFRNYLQALQIAVGVFREAKLKGYTKLKILDIGGGFPAPYDETVKPFTDLAPILNKELDRLFPPPIEIIAEPGRFLVATAATLVATVQGKADRDGKRCYYINDGVYQTYNGIIFDHCRYRVKSFKKGPKQHCAVYGPTCDSLDTIILDEELPDLNIGDLVYTENIGAYSTAASTHFNGFSPASIAHVHD